MILREWDIYRKNRDYLFSEAEHKVKEAAREEVPSLSITAAEDDEDVPDLLLTAVAALVDLDEMSEDAAAGIVASYMKGNVIVRDMYERFIELGNTDEFLQQLKLISSVEEQFTSPRAVAFPTPSKYDAKCESSEDSYNALKQAMHLLKTEEKFGPLEVSALRLASVRRDTFLSHALRYFKETGDYETFRQDLMYVAAKVISETDASMECA
jgi:hypothetical protein